MPPPQSPQFVPRKTRKGKSKQQKDKGAPSSPSSAPNPSRVPWPPLPTGPPPPNVFFPTYPSLSSSFSTPLPPPSMPKKRFLRRVLPLLLTVNLAVGGYVLLSTPRKQLSEKNENAGVELSSLPVEKIEATNS